MTQPESGELVPCSPQWTAAVAEQLNADSRFHASLATWDGAFELRTDDRRAAFKIYGGKVLDAGTRVTGDLAFSLSVPRESWQRMLCAEANSYMNEAMIGSFKASGSGYEYLRLTKPLAYLIDAARTVAGVAAHEVVLPSTSVEPSMNHWAVEGHYVFLGGSLAYVEVSGPSDAERTLVLLHTAGQSGVQYRRSVPVLNALGYRTVVPDYPGHGRSEPAAGGPVTDLGDYADFVVSVLDELSLTENRPYVVGCSIGGKIALELAARLGDRLSGAIAMAADGEPGLGNRRALTRELEDVAAPSRAERTQLGTRAVVDTAVGAELRELISVMHRREDPVISNSDLLGWTSHDLRDRLADVECPLLLVGGADDLWLDLDAVRRTADAVPGARTVVLDGIGHYPPQEMPDFADVLDVWVRELEAGVGR